MNFLIKLMLFFILLVVVAVGSFYYYLDKIAKEAVLSFGPEVTNTRVEVENISVSPFRGEITLSGFAVGNPNGFTDENIFSVGYAEVILNKKSVFEDVIVIRELIINDPFIRYERVGDKDNFEVLLDNIEKAMGMSSNNKNVESKESEQKVIIEKFLLSGASVNARHQLLSDETLSIKLPNLKLNGIGEKSNGVTAKEAGEQIMTQIVAATKKALRVSPQFQAQKKEIKEKAKEKAKEKIKGKLRELGIDKEEVEERKEGIKKLLKGLRG